MSGSSSKPEGQRSLIASVLTKLRTMKLINVYRRVRDAYREAAVLMYGHNNVMW